MEHNEQPRATLTELADSMERFLAENFDGMCLDNNYERTKIAQAVTEWLHGDEGVLVSQHIPLPKAKYRTSFNVVDEAEGKHVVRLVLDRSEQMSDGDFLSLQNRLWCIIGYFIRDDPDVIRALHDIGVRIEIDSPASGGQPQL